MRLVKVMQVIEQGRPHFSQPPASSRFDLKRIAARDIVTRLAEIAKEEKLSVGDDALLAIARGAEGGLRDAESALDQLIAFCGKKMFIQEG